MISAQSLFGWLLAGAVAWFVQRVLRHRAAYPRQNWLLALMDAALAPLRLLGLGPYSGSGVTFEGAMKDAMAATKLTDYGDMQFVKNYKVVTDTAFFKKLTLTNVGYLVAKKELQILLRKRLKFVDFMKRAPEVLAVPIRGPIFVFGLGRSGTTFVHRLMSLDPANRSPRMWELLAPTPEVGPKSTVAEFAVDRERRAEMIREKVRERNRMGQNAMEEFHEIGADLPEECMLGLSADLPTAFQYLYTCLCQPQIFTEDIVGQNVVDAYKRYRSVLQLLSFQTGELNNERRWTLKFPVHILFIRELAAAFPDAKVVWAHRHPAPTVASLSAMMCTLHDIYYDKETCDHAEVGRNMATLCGRILNKAVKDIEDTKVEAAHVIFNDLVKDPIAVVKNIYAQFNMEYTPQFDAAMKAYLVENNAQRAILKAKVEKEGRVFDVHYPEDYGLKTQDLCEGAFKIYLERFNFPEIK